MEVAKEIRTCEVPDEADNVRRFGYPGASRGSSAFPQLRFVAMAECGTHILCYANPGPYGFNQLGLAELVDAVNCKNILGEIDSYGDNAHDIPLLAV